jgi:hypothetical protein
MIILASSMSNNNALCDKDLFYALFVDPLRDEEARRTQGERPALGSQARSIRSSLLAVVPIAKATVFANVQTVLDGTARIFTTLTGDTCYVTIKFTMEKNGERYLKTAQRDTACADKRKSRDKKDELLSRNRQIENVILGIHTEYACDDLRREERLGLYENSRDDWKGFYNATLVVPIAELDNDETKSTILCIDNFRGGLNNKLALSIANYLANRLSIMLHRVSVLDEFSSGTRSSIPGF